MAKLGVYYGLCPLIHHRSLLGVTPDDEKGTVIVTLGQNMAAKFKIADQKQLISWRTRQKLSSPVIIDKGHYVAVFNENFIRMWISEEDSLDKLKKIKFSQSIHTLFSCNGRSFIVFSNGNIELFEKAIENRKSVYDEGVIDGNEYIVEVLSSSFKNEVYVGLVISSNEKSHLIWTKFDENGEKDQFYKVLLDRTDKTLNGFLFHVDNLSINFLSLWSDGRIFSTELKKSDQESANIGDLFATIDAILCTDYVAMVSLDANYIALYGCAASNEGALLVIYNVQFKVVQSRQPFKLFTNGAKIWKINENLMFPVGQNLAVISFHLATEQLAALVGSHQVTFDDEDISIVQKLQQVAWDDTQHIFEKVKKTPKKLKVEIEELLTQGLPETQILEILTQDLIKKENLSGIAEILNYFSNIPEKNLVDILSLALTADGNKFRNRPSNYINCPPQLEPKERIKLIDLILSRSFNEPLILSFLRTNLRFDDVIILMQYISYLISEDGHNLIHLNSNETETRLLRWGSAIIDANYQRLRLSKDDKVKEIFLKFKAQMDETLNPKNTRDITELICLLKDIKRGKLPQKMINFKSNSYSVKELPLY